MITLSKRLKQQSGADARKEAEPETRRISIRDKLLVKEVQEMEENVPRTCKVQFDDPSKLHHFVLFITPDEGFWKGGQFKFDIHVPEEYNIVPPKAVCQTKIWHPNITENGEICLSLLRQNSYERSRLGTYCKLKDVVWGLNSLFSDLLNFDDPLNVDAADHFTRDKESFKAKVKDYIQTYAKR